MFSLSQKTASRFFQTLLYVNIMNCQGPWTLEAEVFVSEGAGRVGQGPDEAQDERFKEALDSLLNDRVSSCEYIYSTQFDLTADASFHSSRVGLMKVQANSPQFYPNL